MSRHEDARLAVGALGRVEGLPIRVSKFGGSGFGVDASSAYKCMSIEGLGGGDTRREGAVARPEVWSAADLSVSVCVLVCLCLCTSVCMHACICVEVCGLVEERVDERGAGGCVRLSRPSLPRFPLAMLEVFKEGPRRRMGG